MNNDKNRDATNKEKEQTDSFMNWRRESVKKDKWTKR